MIERATPGRALQRIDEFDESVVLAEGEEHVSRASTSSECKLTLSADQCAYLVPLGCWGPVGVALRKFVKLFAHHTPSVRSRLTHLL